MFFALLFVFPVDDGSFRRRAEQVGSEPPSNLPISKLSDEEKVALLGRPKLGEVNRTQIRVKESKEFKVGRPLLWRRFC